MPEQSNDYQSDIAYLKSLNAELLDFYNNAPCGFHSLDEKGLILRINKTEIDWLGYTEDEVVGKKYFSEFFTPASLQHFKEQFPLFLKQGYIRGVEFDIICKDKKQMTILVSATAIKDSTGKFIMSRSTLFDITERKQMEEKLIQNADELQKINSFMVGRELKMVELKETIAKLEEKIKNCCKDS